MPRFYYRPVDPGYDEMGRGFARGIYGATDQYARGKERDRQQPMQDLIEARALAEAQQQGIRRGSVPTQPRMDVDAPAGPDFGAMTEPGFGMQPEAQRGGLGVREGQEGGVGLRLMPNADWIQQPQIGAEEGPVRTDYSQWDPDPRYEQLNENFYAMTPEARAQEAQYTQEAERARLVDLLGSINAESGISPEAALELGLEDEFLQSRGVGGQEVNGQLRVGEDGFYHLINPRTGEAEQTGVRAPRNERGEVNGQLKVGADGFYHLIDPRSGRTTKTDVQAPESERGGSSGISDTSRYSQNARVAHDFRQQVDRIRSWQKEPNESEEEFAAAQEAAIADLSERYNMTFEDALEFIRTGEWPEGAAAPEEDAGGGGVSFEDLIGGDFFSGADPAAEGGARIPERGAAPPARGGREAAPEEREAPAEERGERGAGRGARLTRDQITEAKELVSGWPAEERDSALASFGFTPEQIKAILGQDDGEDDDRESMVDRFIRSDRQ